MILLLISGADGISIELLFESYHIWGGDGNDIIDGGHIKDTLYGGTGMIFYQAIMVMII